MEKVTAVLFAIAAEIELNSRLIYLEQLYKMGKLSRNEYIEMLEDAWKTKDECLKAITKKCTEE